MSPLFQRLLAVSAASLFVRCSVQEAGPPPRPLNETDRQLAESTNAFGFNFFKQISSEAADKSVFVSPPSVSLALGMTLNGAAGNTHEEMHRTLALGELTPDQANDSYGNVIRTLQSLDRKVILQIADSIWCRKGLSVKPEFLGVNSRHFNAEIRAIDFGDPGASKTINGWVERSTKGKIPKIVPDPIPADVVMYLINAIYFKGTWTTAFDPTQTREDVFTTVDGTKTPCKLMHRGGECRYLETNLFQAVDLPYGEGAFNMTVFLPKPERGLEFFIGQLDRDRWTRWMSGFAERKGDLFLPRFKLEYEKTLNDVLKAMGMRAAFGSGADFSGIGPGLCITEVKHKTFVEVNEEGTEAAAATSVEVALSAMVPGPFTMRVDRPFAFVIRESRTGAILFIGKVVELKV